MSANTDIRVPKIAELIAEQIQDDIAAGRVRAGDSLPSEAAIMTSFGASRPPVREALRILESDGLISVRRGSRGGIWVIRPDHRTVAAKMRNAMKLWGTDATEAAALVAGAELAAVQSLAEHCRQTGQEPSIGVPVSDGGFHRRLIGCSGARLAESLITALGDMVASECTDAGAHSRALRAIEDGDAHGATRVWRSHQARPTGR
jgi:DNA-binding FadR family transcriptional regulator